MPNMTQPDLDIANVANAIVGYYHNACQRKACGYIPNLGLDTMEMPDGKLTLEFRKNRIDVWAEREVPDEADKEELFSVTERRCYANLNTHQRMDFPTFQAGLAFACAHYLDLIVIGDPLESAKFYQPNLPEEPTIVSRIGHELYRELSYRIRRAFISEREFAITISNHPSVQLTVAGNTLYNLYADHNGVKS